MLFRSPSNTQILKDFGISTVLYESQVMNDAMRRGRLVHACGHLIAGGKTIDPAWTERHPECLGYTAGIESFLSRHDFRLFDAELEVCCETERYVTHPDWLGFLDDIPADIDIKTGACPAWAGIQLGGQLYALRSTKYPNADKMIRVALELPGNGTFKLKYFTDPREMSEFVILARAWHIRGKYGVAQ